MALRPRFGAPLSWTFGWLVAWSMVAPASAQIEPCALDPGPAATLLLPHFRVDLNNPSGTTTLFSITNTEAEAVLTRVTLWTDIGIPTLAFSVYLTGYDVETINLRDVLAGILPRTASPQQDPSDTVSPVGDFSQDTSFPNCDGFLPPANLTPAQILDLRAEHGGRRPSVRLGGYCASYTFPDGVARGYVTIDTVSRCSALTPRDPGYFGAGGDATAQNVLMGDYFFVEPADNFASGDPLVRIQAFPGRFGPGDRTFYAWLHGGSTLDQREPLAFSWFARFLNGGAFSGGTEMLAWQDAATPFVPFQCVGVQIPPPVPYLNNVGLAHFNESEDVEIPSCFPSGPPCPPFVFFPWISNRIRIGGPDLPTSYAFGYLLAQPQVPLPRQLWVGTVMKASGRYSVGFAATPLDSACGQPRPTFCLFCQ